MDINKEIAKISKNIRLTRYGSGYWKVYVPGDNSSSVGGKWLMSWSAARELRAHFVVERTLIKAGCSKPDAAALAATFCRGDARTRVRKALDRFEKIKAAEQMTFDEFVEKEAWRS